MTSLKIQRLSITKPLLITFLKLDFHHKLHNISQIIFGKSYCFYYMRNKKVQIYFKRKIGARGYSYSTQIQVKQLAPF